MMLQEFLGPGMPEEITMFFKAVPGQYHDFVTWTGVYVQWYICNEGCHIVEICVQARRRDDRICGVFRLVMLGCLWVLVLLGA